MKVWKKVWNTLYRGDQELTHRMFNLIMSSGIVAALAGAVCVLTVGGTLDAAPVFAVIGALVLILWFANRFNKIPICAVFTALAANCGLLPWCFFQSGGVDGVINLWFAFGLIYIFMLIKGPGFFVTMGISLCSITGCYVAAYLRPELVSADYSRLEIYKDTAISVLIIAALTGVLLHVQMAGYNRERDKLKQKQREQDAAGEDKDRFFASISHELRTPINTILGLNEMNLRQPLSGEVEENCLYIQNAGSMLLALINDVLDFSKMQSGNMEIVNGQYEIISMINELYITFKARANSKKLKFVLDISSDIPSVLWGDEVRIKQIVSNLLTNAVKYTEEGKILLQIKCQKLDDHSVNLRFSVADTGMGIKKEDIPALFEEFKRVDTRKNNAIEGTGLGLPICKRLASMMNGEIIVDSVYHKGSTFTFSVNQNIVDAAPIGQLNDVLHSKIGKRYSYRRTFEAPDARVLVVDDNEMNRVVVQKILKNTRVQIDMAESGARCLELTREKQYHVIFMDHLMPGMDGEETLAEVRKQRNGLCNQSPVIALTANAEPGIEKQYLAKGFDGYLVKPVNSMKLEETLMSFLPEELVKVYANVQGGEGAKGQDGIFVGEKQRHKKNIRITVESSCDLSEELMREHEIDSISCYVRVEDKRFCDGGEISYGAALDYLRKGVKIQMEVPGVEEYEDFFADELDTSYQVLHISSSSKIDTGFANARKAAGSFGNVYVFDSGHVSGGTGLLTLYAADMVKQGMQLEEVVRRLESIKKNIAAAFMIGDTEAFLYNKKGNSLLGRICGLFLLKMVVHVRDGELKCGFLHAGTREKEFRKFVDRQLKRAFPSRADRLFMVYTGCSTGEREIILQEIERRVKFGKVHVLAASPSGSSISGLRSVGLYYLKE